LFGRGAIDVVVDRRYPVGLRGIRRTDPSWRVCGGQVAPEVERAVASRPDDVDDARHSELDGGAHAHCRRESHLVVRGSHVHAPQHQEIGGDRRQRLPVRTELETRCLRDLTRLERDVYILVYLRTCLRIRGVYRIHTTTHDDVYEISRSLRPSC